MVRAAVSVIGSGSFEAGEKGETLRRAATETGALLASGGFDIVCGGLGGVMEAACLGARQALDSAKSADTLHENRRPRIVGLLPGHDRREGNSYLDVAVATGLGQMRNYLVVANGDATLAVGGGAGTLSEIGLAQKIGRPVVVLDQPGYGNWAQLPGIVHAATPAQAVSEIRKLIQEN